MDVTTQTKTNDRILYFDFLRVFATLAVMVLHVGAQNWNGTSVPSFEWQTFNVFHSITRFGVPIFVMISGALFLNKRELYTITVGGGIYKLYKHNILRIVTAFIFWSAVYALPALLHGSSFKVVCKRIITGYYHMWFLFMIVGLYMIVPFVKKIVESPVLTKYFLALALVFTFIIPQARDIASVFHKDLTVELVNSVISKMNLSFIGGYTCYFILGHCLHTIELSKKARCIIYALSTLGFASTVLGCSFISIYNNKPNQILCGNFTLNVMLQGVGVFVFFKNLIDTLKISERMQAIIARLSKYSFGAYLVHALIIEVLNKIGLNTMSFNPVLSVISISAIVFVISFVVSYVCNHIPVLNKYIV